MSDAHKLMITLRKAPHGTIYVQEAIEVMFIMASFEMDLSIVFIDDGVFSVKKGQDTKDLGIKGFSASLGALADWDVKNVYVDSDSLKDRNISTDQLISVGEDDETEETVYPRALSTDQLKEMMKQQDTILSF
ncbi:MAG: sulfurtransferase TusC [endosymbiont of Galathealinum brachiosum]|uniref:Sulfurtransferase TusC n=1 Tax=endosymbiont of Galathealinum brachiosum TaxID=2200906 RepID=A0A370DCY7_9GAMM|nr:MAG: sulfurtransferase TusC [endosymbiont of Galathealinum brachiosum]